MIVDVTTRVASNQALSPSATTTLTSVVDLGPVSTGGGREVGQGEDIYAVISITTSFANTGDTYFQVGYGSDTTPTTFYPLGQTQFFAQADCTAGKQFVCRFNPMTTASTANGYQTPLIGRQYLCVRVVNSAGTPASVTGNFNCDIVHGIQGSRGAYASGLPAFIAGA